ncbi:MAG: caspase family protein, partial [Spirochaetales bacterium]|nr:caspase family protein [Spirochaetales bacterium]
MLKLTLIAMAIVLIPMATFAQDRGLLTITAREITGNPTFDVGRQYAVIIGIDKYKDWPALRNAVSEARSVRDVLARRYFIDEFIELYDKNATASSIRRLFTEELPAKVGTQDSLFIFYAGHGYLDESNTGFWIAVDGVKDVLDQRGWIPNQQIRNYISMLKAQRILVVADACFSGDFLNVSRGSGPSIDSAYFEKALQLQARQVLTSGSSETVPDESEFGRYLVTTLERNADAVLDPFTMYDRIRRSVKHTVPLLGTIPGNETGASFAFFLRPATGSLAVSTAAPARVFADGTERGAVSPGKPLIINDVPVGSHELRIVYAGSEERKSVAIVAGETTKSSFSWKPPQSGRLAVSSQADARVLIDGVIVGSVASGATLEVAEVIAGERVVTLQYADNQEDRRVRVY